jgi:hypothetical protein
MKLSLDNLAESTESVSAVSGFWSKFNVSKDGASSKVPLGRLASRQFASDSSTSAGKPENVPGAIATSGLLARFRERSLGAAVLNTGSTVMLLSLASSVSSVDELSQSMFASLAFDTFKTLRFGNARIALNRLV